MRCLPAIPLLLPSLSLSLQYQLDMNYMAKHKSEDVYSSFNLIMRYGSGSWDGAGRRVRQCGIEGVMVRGSG